jgi:hypothetical protein
MLITTYQTKPIPQLCSGITRLVPSQTSSGDFLDDVNDGIAPNILCDRCTKLKGVFSELVVWQSSGWPDLSELF